MDKHIHPANTDSCYKAVGFKACAIKLIGALTLTAMIIATVSALSDGGVGGA